MAGIPVEAGKAYPWYWVLYYAWHRIYTMGQLGSLI